MVDAVNAVLHARDAMRAATFHPEDGWMATVEESKSSAIVGKGPCLYRVVFVCIYVYVDCIEVMGIEESRSVRRRNNLVVVYVRFLTLLREGVSYRCCRLRHVDAGTKGE